MKPDPNPRTCPCGKWFYQKYVGEKYCSNKCAGKYGTSTLPASKK